MFSINILFSINLKFYRKRRKIISEFIKLKFKNLFGSLKYSLYCFYIFQIKLFWYILLTDLLIPTDEDEQNAEVMQNFNGVRTRISQLYSKLNSGEHQLKQEQNLIKKLELLKEEVLPLQAVS